MADGFEKIDLMNKAQTIGQVGQAYKAATIITGPQKIDISGDYVIHSWWFGADELVFKPRAISERIESREGFPNRL